MENRNEKSDPKQTQKPGSMSSFNNRSETREGQVEEVKEQKDEGESYMDYNGNSESNAPARAREGEE